MHGPNLLSNIIAFVCELFFSEGNHWLQKLAEGSCSIGTTGSIVAVPGMLPFELLLEQSDLCLGRLLVLTYGMGCLHCLSFWHSSCDLDQPIFVANILDVHFTLRQAGRCRCRRAKQNLT